MFLAMSLHLSDHQVLHNIAGFKFFSISLGFSRFFRSYFALPNFWSWRNLIKQLFHSRLLDTRLVIAQLGATRLVKPAAHLRKKLSKLPREAVCSAVSSRVRGNCGEKFALRGRENRAELGLIKHPIKIHGILTDSSGSGWCRRKKFRPHWSHVRMPCILIGCFIDQAQLDSHDGRTQWGICLARRKISNMFDFFLTASRGQFLTKSSPHTVRKRLSKPPREAVYSALSSPCAAGFSYLAPHIQRALIEQLWITNKPL